jgi:hypothetical protein
LGAQAAGSDPGRTSIFLSLGVGDWQSFDLLIGQLRENRPLIRRWMEIYGEFAAQLADKILNRVKVDAALFNEPIGGLTGSLISPAMYRELVLPGYQPILDVLARYPTVNNFQNLCQCPFQRWRCLSR